MPPSRPSAAHLRAVADAIADVPRDRPVAVLGSTPEFRDLLTRRGFSRVYVIDKSHIAFHRMTALRASTGPETFVHDDWLTALPNFSHEFSCILSDLTSGNIPYDLHSHFYDAIAGALTSDGIFVDKVLTHLSHKRRLTDLLPKYDSLPLNLLYINHFSCEFLFASELLNINHTVDTSRFYDILSTHCTTPALRGFLLHCPKITPRGCLWYYGKPWDEVSKPYTSALSILRTTDDDAHSPYHGNLKLILSRPRQR